MSGSYDILRLAGLIADVKVLQDVRNAKLKMLKELQQSLLR